MARPREFDTEKVLASLRDVFWEHGYEGTSYADIMAATDLKKGSLYAAFGDKRALYHQALAHYDKENVSDAIAILLDESVPGEARIAALMQSLVDAAETKTGRWGCLLCNAAVDQAPSHQPTEIIVQQMMERLKRAIGKALGAVAAADKVELIWTLYFGGRVVIKSGASKAVLIRLKEQSLSILTAA